MPDIIDRLNSHEWCDAVDDAIEVIKVMRGEIGGLHADMAILTAGLATEEARVKALTVERDALRAELAAAAAENISLRLIPDQSGPSDALVMAHEALIRHHQTHHTMEAVELSALRDACFSLSAVTSYKCGDLFFEGEPSDDDSPADYVVKSAFRILEKLDEAAPGWNSNNAGEINHES